MREPTRRRRPSDLYSLGIPLVLDDGDTDWLPELDGDGNPVLVPVVDTDGHPVLDADNNVVMEEVLVETDLPPINVWVAKLSDIEMTTAMKKAAQAQAVVMAARKDHDSEDWLAIRVTMAALDRETWIQTLVERELVGRRDLIEARVAGETSIDIEGEEEPSEWAKDDYLEGLRDAWLDGLNATYAVDPGDPEASRVYSEIDRFNRIVDEEYAYDREVEEAVLETLGDEVLLDKVTDLMTETEGQSAWADEYRLRCIFLASRQCDGPDPERAGRCLCKGKGRKHAEYLFESYEEVTVTDGRIRNAIYAAFNAVMVDVREGKGLRANRASLQQSGSPVAEATSTSSGLADATA